MKKLLRTTLSIMVVIGVIVVSDGTAFASGGKTTSFVTALSQTATQSTSTHEIRFVTTVRADRQLTSMNVVINLYGGLFCVAGTVPVDVITNTGTSVMNADVSCFGGGANVTPAASITLTTKLAQGTVVVFRNTIGWTAAGNTQTFSNGSYRNASGNSSVVFTQTFGDPTPAPANTFSADGTLEYAASGKTYATVAPGCAFNPATGIAQPYINLFLNGSYTVNVSVNGVALTQLSSSRTHTPVFLGTGTNTITGTSGTTTDIYIRDGGVGSCTI